MKQLSLGLAALFLALAGNTGTAAKAETIVLGGYPNYLLLVDEEAGALTERVELASGLPVSLQESIDGRYIYVTTLTTSGIEIFDTRTRRIVKSLSLNTPFTKYRFRGGTADPAGRYFYTIGTRIDKEIDRYRIGERQFMVIDLESGEVVRTAELGDEEAGWRTQLLMSEDGETLYLFGEKIAIIDVDTLEVVDRIDLSKPAPPGMRDIGFRGSIDTLSTPGEFVSVFNSKDPYIHNEIFGIARFDLSSRDVDFTPIGPAPDRASGLMVTPDGKDGYTVVSTGERGERRCEFWHFDLSTNKVADRSEFPCRSRFSFGMSADGEKLYIYAAGFEIEVYDAQSFELEETWDLNNDITGAGMLFLP